MKNNYVLVYHPDADNKCCREIYFEDFECALKAFDDLGSALYVVRIFPLTAIAMNEMEEAYGIEWREK